MRNANIPKKLPIQLVGGFIKKLFKKKGQQRITITFLSAPGGMVTTLIDYDKDIPVGYASTAIERLKGEVATGLAHKLNEVSFKSNDPRRRSFIRKQTLGDILK